MMPTAFSAAASIDADIGDETRDQLVHDPLTLPHWRRVVVILNVVRGDDKRVALSHAQSCRCAHTLSQPHVK